MFIRIIKKFKKSPFEYLLLFILLSLAFMIRVYRINKTLGFYFDQGRDALVIWDLINRGKLFLIGPTTGIEGIFRGPFYYYLIAPFYWLGRGNPVYPSVFLALTSVVAIGILYSLGKRLGGVATGLIVVVMASFSYQLFYASRWLSNPTPMLLLSVILLWAIMEIWKGNARWWMVAASVSGLSLFHFGSAAELYYLLALGVIFLWKRKFFPNLKIIFVSGLLFFLTLAPQLVFDLRHGGILSNNFRQTFFSGESFALPTKQFVKDKVVFYADVFTQKLLPQQEFRDDLLLTILGVIFLVYLRDLVKQKGVTPLLILLFAPMVGLVFFRGNNSVVYDYYLTGYYLPFILLVALVLGCFWKSKLGKVLVVYFFLLFFIGNLRFINSTVNNRADDNRSIVLTNEEQAIDWVYQNSVGSGFNVDVYVPPVVPHAYNYLFKWLGSTKYNREPGVERVPLLYTLYETDLSNPDRLIAWLARQATIGQVEESRQFGGITVERRIRLK